MSDLLTALLDDLDAETRELTDVVARLGDDGWRLATPAAGWDVAMTVAHLLWTDRAALLAAGSVTGGEPGRAAWDALVEQALADPAGFVDDEAAALAAQPRAEVLETWESESRALREALRDFPDGQRLAWFGPPMSPASMATARLMETWAHGLDVHEVAARQLGTPVPAPTDRIRPIAHLGVRTRDFAYATHGEPAPTEPFRIELVAPSGEPWTWGPEDAAQRVTGSAYDFCRLVTQRLHRSDTDLVAVGPDAEHWLDIAQAFAGPPGSGRGPRG